MNKKMFYSQCLQHNLIFSPSSTFLILIEINNLFKFNNDLLYLFNVLYNFLLSLFKKY